jgi:hypothetical protein
MMNSTFRLARRTVLAAAVAAALWCAPGFAQERYRCAVEGCTIAHEHTHGGGGNASGAVNEYEAFRIWRDRTGRKDATYQDYLEAKNNGGRDVNSPQPPRRPVPPPPESRPVPDRVRPPRPIVQPQVQQRRPDRPQRHGPLHQDCRAHLNDYARFSEFPCIIERACKKCPTTLVMYASTYEYDKYNRLEEIEYYPAICPNCRYENELKIKFHD